MLLQARDFGFLFGVIEARCLAQDFLCDVTDGDEFHSSPPKT